MNVIGIAGRAGSGKSAVAEALARRDGVTWVDLDRTAWATYAPGTEGYRRVVERFGQRIVAADKTVDRAALGAVVFADPAAREDLERIVHPAVGERLRAIRDNLEHQGVRILLAEGALLASSPHVDRSEFDVIVWLEASPAVRRERLRRAGRADHADRGDTIPPPIDAIVIDASGPVADVCQRVWRVIERLETPETPAKNR